MPKLLQDINLKLAEYGIPVRDFYKSYSLDDANIILMSNQFVLEVNEEMNEVHIAFHVSVPPNDSASVCIILNEIEYLELYVAELFIYDSEKDKILSGDVAKSTYEEKQKKIIIEEFVKEQKEIHWLAMTTEGRC